jgi:uncharacterized protein (TIGR03435 family)
MRKNVSLLVATIALAVLLIAQAQSSEPKVGDPPPPLKLKTLLQAPEGTKASWGALKGKVVVLEFWATWCGPCVGAISHLNELAWEFKDRPVQFIAVTDEGENVIAPFLKKKPMHAWIGLDTDKSMFKDYGITSIPHTVVVDKTGRIAAITYPMGLSEQVLNDLLAGKKLALALPTLQKGIRPGEVPDESDRGQPALFQVLIQPSSADYQHGSGVSSSGNGGLTMSGMTVFDVLGRCYGFSDLRILTNSTLPAGKFDFVVKTPEKDYAAATSWLRQATEAAFGLVAKRQTNDMDVLLLSVAMPTPVGLAPTVSNGGSSYSSGPGQFQAINQGSESIAGTLEYMLGKPVINETGLTNRYDFKLKWTVGGDERAVADALTRAVREQLGLRLTAARQPVEVLVVDRAAK